MKPIVSNAEIISHIQIERDQAMYDLYRMQNEMFEIKTIMKANCFLNFDLLQWRSCLIPIVTDFEILNFIIKNKSELKRNMTFAEFYNFSMDFRLVKERHLEYPHSFVEFKEMYSKIKPVNTKL